MNIYAISAWFSEHLARIEVTGFFVLMIVGAVAAAAWADRHGSRYPFP